VRLQLPYYTLRHNSDFPATIHHLVPPALGLQFFYYISCGLCRSRNRVYHYTGCFLPLKLTRPIILVDFKLILLPTCNGQRVELCSTSVQVHALLRTFVRGNKSECIITIITEAKVSRSTMHFLPINSMSTTVTFLFALYSEKRCQNTYNLHICYQTYQET
jgi:hypothetical protein